MLTKLVAELDAASEMTLCLVPHDDWFALRPNLDRRRDASEMAPRPSSFIHAVDKVPPEDETAPADEFDEDEVVTGVIGTADEEDDEEEEAAMNM